ncbi:AGE family epimerase/isomerase [Paracoccus benzoatiresistens]|uniref:AGE family epimerase/isomerase n=1 Tax=Paracoccus benzoatiresistens TaxID=2997341 RepID=A0ABT4JAQ6_9RHOB|nr:AGE family epimerase/isomerase [Paracoccus sp. EF6]MCZ0963687.1 AGE family epimerase/isomerase [Paracoccus sp. EF6]
MSIADDLRHWALNDAFPLWAAHGLDQSGGYFELLQADLSPVEHDRRARLTARQIFCFCAARQMGWDGPAEACARHGLDFLTANLISPDGRVIMACSPGGAVAKNGHDLYDDAFVLFGLASFDATFGPDPQARAAARRIATHLVDHYGREDGLFNESVPAAPPLLANPHMHLLEGFLAWAETDDDVDRHWLNLASGIARRALSTLIQTDPVVLPEVYALDVTPIRQQGDWLLIEPGHQFEWGWLLWRWAGFVNEPAAREAALAIASFGENYGVDAARGAVVNAIDETGTLRDGNAKLWPQTERAKFWHVVSIEGPPELRAEAMARRDQALVCLKRFLDAGALPGLWREVLTLHEGFVEEPVRASSLYHALFAILTITGTTKAGSIRDLT